MFAAPDQLAHVPPAAGLVGCLLLGERVRLVGEVAAEDDRVGPYVADHVRRRVGDQRAPERLAERAARDQPLQHAPRDRRADHGAARGRRVEQQLLGQLALELRSRRPSLSRRDAPDRDRAELEAGHHRAADRGPRDVVLDDLRPRLARDPLQFLAHLPRSFSPARIAVKSRSWKATPHSNSNISSTL